MLLPLGLALPRGFHRRPLPRPPPMERHHARRAPPLTTSRWLPYVSRALGHSSEAMTAKAYVHEFEAQRSEEDERAAAMLEEFVG
jgi:hypothetical protein